MKKLTHILSAILTVGSFALSAKAEARVASYTSGYPHQAFQTLHSVSPQGNRIQLSDGSHWDVESSYYYTTANWRPGDVIQIAANQSYFSYATYAIQNVSTNSSISATLSIGPVVDSTSTHWITGINYATAQVVLEDESVWKVWDTGDLKHWALHDTILIGTYPTWFSSYNIILINASVDFSAFLRAKAN